MYTTPLRGLVLLTTMMTMLSLQIGCGGSSTPSTPPAPTATAQLSIGSLMFTQAAGAPGTAQTVTVTNSGSAVLTIGSIALGGTDPSDFSQTSTCGASLAAGATCTVSVTFTAAAAGSYSASLIFTDNAASGSPQTVALSGTATAPATPGTSLSATSLSFASSSSAAQTVTVTNSGSAVLTIGSIVLGGTDPSDFSQTSTCGTSLAAGATCTVSVTFTAATAGSYSASLIFTDNASGSPQHVALSGTAAGPALTLSLGSPSVAYGQGVAVTAKASSWATPSTGTVTFYGGNTGAVPIGSVSLSNDSASFIYTPSVSGTVAVSAVLTSGTNSLTSQTLPLTVTPTAITTNLTNPAAWTMSNGIITVTYDSQTFAITQLTAVVNGVTQDIVDSTVAFPNIGHGAATPQIYALFGGTGSAGTGADSTSDSAVGNNASYIDFWQDQPVDATSTAEIQNHWVLAQGFSGLILYAVVKHSASAGPLTAFGDSFVIKASDLNLTSLYYTNYSFNSLGQFSANFPTMTEQYAAGQVGNPGCTPTCSGRNLGHETVEYTGLPSIADLYENYTMASGATGTINRSSLTKYDYATASEFHTPRGYIGSDGVAEWVAFPTMETHTGGPNQVDLMGVSSGTGMMTLGWASNHLGGAQYTAPQGVDTSRFFGPFLYSINGTASATPQTIASEAVLQADAQANIANLMPVFDSETTMVADGYVPLDSTTQRASATISVANSSGWPTTPYANLAILADPQSNFQSSNVGYQYWSYLNSSGQATFSNVRPGTYRLSVYQRGQWGELRDDGVTLTAGNSANINPAAFTPENFGPNPPIWTIGTPDRSAHEFEYGHVANGGPDLNQFLASYDYWGDLNSSSVPGAVVYYATADGTHQATGNLNAFPYNFWYNFDPNLYAGLFNSSDQTVDGYNDVVATSAPYINGTPATYNSPPWQIHFTVTPTQIAQGQYVEVSIGLVAQESDLFVSLNGSPQIIWHKVGQTADDAMQRSGVTGYYTWAVFEFPSSDLIAGQDNVLTLSLNSAWGDMWDALRMEITPTSSNPTVTNWHDYTYMTTSTTTLPNDTVPSN